MYYTFLSIILLTAPLAATDSSPTSNPAPTTATEQNHHYVTTEQLKSWYDQKKAMVVLDARSKSYFDGRLLPQAKWLPYDASESEIVKALPNKDSLIVVYCVGVTCPASGWLYDRLYALGYHNVYEYHEGLNEWTQKGYPMTKQEG